MTNIEFAATLEKLAAKYRENETLPRAWLQISLYDKESLAFTLKTLGGKWNKAGMEDDSEHASLRFTSPSLTPLLVYIPRDKVCRKTVTYECDPIMSPAEEAEMLA